MPSPFPGMNPYLEASTFWSAFHSRLIVAIADAVAPYLLPKYYIEIETRTYISSADNSLLVGIPDAVVFSPQSPASQISSSSPATVRVATVSPKRVILPMPEEVKERYLEVREVATGEVIAAIEVLSPKNKTAGLGRQTYSQKRQTVLGSLTHLVEIDLIRGGRPIAIAGEDINTDYRILVSRSYQRPFADLYEFSLQQTIPNFPLPLQQGEAEPIVELQAILHGIYDRAGYDLRIDYQQPPPPPALSRADAKWLAECREPPNVERGTVTKLASFPCKQGLFIVK